MLCARLIRPGELSLTREEIPQPTPDRPLIKVSAVGLCGSDAHWYEHGSTDDTKLEQPLILGHEFAGTVETGSWAGRRVAVDPAVPCQSCDACAEGLEHLCRNVEFAGHGRNDGALRGYLTWPERCLVPLPDELTDAEGALLEPLGVSLHAIDLAQETAAHPGPLAIGGGLRFRPDRAASDRCAQIVGAFQCHCHRSPAAPLVGCRSYGGNHDRAGDLRGARG